MGCGGSKATDVATSPTERIATDLPVDKLHGAVRWQKLDEVQKIYKQSPQTINKADAQNGNTAIHIASQNGHIDLVKLLISYKCNVNAQNKGGQTPLHMAISYDLDEVVAILNKAGADLNIKNEAGNPAFHGLEGEKDPASGKFKLKNLQVAEKEAEFLSSLEALKGCKDVDKAQVVQVALARKRECKPEWTTSVQTKLGDLLTSLE
mmetsp:Transcript_9641/g.13092  ORF Transcript_9641/g.13092 Transcript_9641/m.13092 type:complete len:207 (-) Transcript_9641:228-848(-)|eukprot:CAMPEP_0196594726 /NCGR_PEP_ID=MMETSP1081-20130531/79104_1 /TAXON_ID=36882 /ORGANISM="Pyramimonas amylifera, Strain CCMP720" /LENGTH=206 /DNA_ID=CAMNT_0041919067 /DNA_START=356 /DNA_END=976 /DNA_ORIENTATION=+